MRPTSRWRLSGPLARFCRDGSSPPLRLKSATWTRRTAFSPPFQSAHGAGEPHRVAECARREEGRPFQEGTGRRGWPLILFPAKQTRRQNGSRFAWQRSGTSRQVAGAERGGGIWRSRHGSPSASHQALLKHQADCQMPRKRRQLPEDLQPEGRRGMGLAFGAEAHSESTESNSLFIFRSSRKRGHKMRNVSQKQGQLKHISSQKSTLNPPLWEVGISA